MSRILSRKRAEAPPIRSWMLTFCDLLTLLIGFFVLRLSMSSLGSKSAQESFSAFREATQFELIAPQTDTRESTGDAGSESSAQTKGGSGAGPTFLSKTLSHALAGLTHQTGEKEAAVPISPDFDVRQDPQGTIISLGSSVFPPGSDELSFQAKVNIDALTKVLVEQIARGEKFEIRVEGHTDDVPINSPRFPSNWELSSARATQVAQQIIENGIDPQIVSAVGYANTKPLTSGNSLEDERKNRRVELLIIPVKSEE